jgi:hypothetical protein
MQQRCGGADTDSGDLVKYPHLMSCSLLTVVMSTGACLVDATESDEGRSSRGRDDDGGEDACEAGHLRQGSACVAVPVLSVFLSESVDEAADAPIQRAVVTTMQPVRDERVDLATVRASDGACVIFEPFEGSSVLAIHEPGCGDWGTVEVAGSPVPYACEGGVAQRFRDISYSPDTAVAVRGSGGDVFPSFAGNITTPARINAVVDGEIAAGATFTLTWSGPDDTDELQLSVTAIGEDGEVVHIFCDPAPGTTALTITPTLSNLLPSPVFNWNIAVSASRRAELAWDDAPVDVELSVGAVTTTVLRAPQD